MGETKTVNGVTFGTNVVKDDLDLFGTGYWMRGEDADGNYYTVRFKSDSVKDINNPVSIEKQ